MKIMIFAAAICLALSASKADAATLKLEYMTDGGGLLEASLEGTVLGDGDTVEISAVSDVKFGGDARSIGAVGAFSTFPAVGTTPLLSFSGDTLDFFACQTPSCDVSFFILTTTFFGATSDFGGMGDAPYNQSQYSLTVAAVPIPASLPLLAFGLGGLGLMVRRKRKAS